MVDSAIGATRSAPFRSFSQQPPDHRPRAGQILEFLLEMIRLACCLIRLDWRVCKVRLVTPLHIFHQVLQRLTLDVALHVLAQQARGLAIVGRRHIRTVR